MFIKLFYFCSWLIEAFFFIFWLFLWVWVIFCLIVWLKGIGGGFEESERQFEEENLRGVEAELKAKKTTQRGKKGKRKAF